MIYFTFDTFDQWRHKIFINKGIMWANPATSGSSENVICKMSAILFRPECVNFTLSISAADYVN